MRPSTPARGCPGRRGRREAGPARKNRASFVTELLNCTYYVRHGACTSKYTLGFRPYARYEHRSGRLLLRRRTRLLFLRGAAPALPSPLDEARQDGDQGRGDKGRADGALVFHDSGLLGDARHLAGVEVLRASVNVRIDGMGDAANARAKSRSARSAPPACMAARARCSASRARPRPRGGNSGRAWP